MNANLQKRCSGHSMCLASPIDVGTRTHFSSRDSSRCSTASSMPQELGPIQTTVKMPNHKLNAPGWLTNSSCTMYACSGGNVSRKQSQRNVFVTSLPRFARGHKQLLQSHHLREWFLCENATSQCELPHLPSVLCGDCADPSASVNLRSRTKSCPTQNSLFNHSFARSTKTKKPRMKSLQSPRAPSSTKYPTVQHPHLNNVPGRQTDYLVSARNVFPARRSTNTTD
mmetsp:Transcript_22676/g.36129  ORF Transcript_22676/g.36129 Transcript_22676/m.36129 type:complete len:226 (+) Transcript_22676:2574-3251(+)